MPDPIKPDLWGTQSLLKFPEARVMVVQGKANFEAAQRMFVANPVVGFDGPAAKSATGVLRNRDLIVWLNMPLPQAITDEAPAFVDARSLVFFAPDAIDEMCSPSELEAHRMPRQWFMDRLKTVVVPQSEPQTHVNGHAAATVPPKAEALPAAPERPRRAFGVVEPDGAVRAIAPEPERLPAKYSEDAIATAFTAAHPDLRYVSAWGKWLKWNGSYWRTDDTLTVFDQARKTCRAQAEKAKLDDVNQSTIRGIVSSRTVAAVERLARADPEHAAISDQWDADPWLLNTPNGIVDLTNGELRPGRPEDHQSRITRVSPGGECPAWLEFLSTATNADAELMAFMQRMAGYSLTGNVREHALFFVYGKGGNGKGTFLNQLTWILGDYAHTASMDSFTESRSDQHPTSTASLMGRRLVSAQETEEGRRWAESKIKSMTGGDPITARFMRQDEFTFQPQFKLVVVGNHKPVFRNVDDAIRRRLHLIPFTHKVNHPDTKLPEKLREEAPGILAWAIQGCLNWQRDGLNPPECVKVATEDYLVSQDSMATWISECCDLVGTWSTKVSVLFESYRGWCERNGEYVIGRKRFVEALLTRGFDKIEERHNSLIKGIKVRPPEEPQAAYPYMD